MTPLPAGFTAHPFAHRGLHGIAGPENSPSAFRAAVERGFGIELDLQISADGRAMVFHDHALDRLTAEVGPVRDRTAAELGAIRLKRGADMIPTLDAVLRLVAGRVPLLIEVKDQDGAMGTSRIGPLEYAVARALNSYTGPVAVMSFNPHSVAAMQKAAPNTPRGLVTDDWSADAWPNVAATRRDALRTIADYDLLGCSFISHDASDLHRPRVAELRDQGATILTWTVRSHEAERAARRIAHAVTFEGYLPVT
jgi:glycerophosphoryl diester phosphodiesterase